MDCIVNGVAKNRTQMSDFHFNFLLLNIMRTAFSFQTGNAKAFCLTPKQPQTSPSTLCESVKMLVTQLCPTLCDPMDCSPPGPSVYGISQARILE